MKEAHTENPKEFPRSKKLCIAKSKVHGYGIFARVPIKKHEIVYIIKGKIKKLTIKNELGALSNENWIGMGPNTWIDPAGFGRYQNHSQNPNCGIRGRVAVCALHDIRKGEEITIDYAITEEQTLWRMEDSTRNGRKVIVRSIQFLPMRKFKKYLPFIPRYFQRVYLRYNKSNAH